MDVHDVELAAVRRAFCMLVARWRLTQAELRTLLSSADVAAPPGRVLPDDVDAEGERRMRLLLRLDAAFARLTAGGDVGARLRGWRAAKEEGPLGFLSDARSLWVVTVMAERAAQDGWDVRPEGDGGR